MTRTHKLLMIFVLLSAFVFTAIGYAQLTDQLTITGHASASPPEGLVILEVKDTSSFGVTNYKAGTVHSSTVDLGSNPKATASFTITVFNNTGYSYYFDKMVWDEDAYDNTNITPTLSGITAKYELKNLQTVTFTVTFAYRNASQIQNTVLNSVINYQFVPNENDAGNIVVRNAIEKFKEILNDDAIGGAFETLIDNMDIDGRRANETYIGNVVGADSDDTRVVNDLFSDEVMNYLVLQLGDGEAKEVTAIIKRQPLDGQASTGTDIVNDQGVVTTAGCEMTMYLTPDDIPADRLIFGSGGSTITVYAVVFTTDAMGNWYQLSPLYQGTATTNNYDGNTFFATANSFNTDTWRSVAASYGTADGTIVSVPTGETITELISSKKY